MTYLAKRLVPRLVKCKQAGTAGLAALLVLLVGCSAIDGTSLPPVEVPAEVPAPAAEPVTQTAVETEITPTSTSSTPIPKGELAPEIPPAPDLAAEIPPAPDLLAVPQLDTTVASVPLSEILFDTFGRTPGRYVSLDRAREELILGLRDAIAPVYHPVYGGAGDLPWLEDTNLVIGYVAGDRAYAYPINILNLHELVNDELAGVPVLISYCPLCASGVVYSRKLDEQTLLFGNTSALYQSDLVMFDHQTGSYWFQTGGEAVVGSLTGKRLELLPAVTMAWGEWKMLYPETGLLTGTASSPTQFAGPRYAREIFSGYAERVNDNKFAFPVNEENLDDRLPAGEVVLTAEVGESVTAYPLGPLGNAAVNDRVGEQPVAVFIREDNRAAGVFSPTVDAQTLTFVYEEEREAFFDRETGSEWDSAGRSIAGPLRGAQLTRLESRRAFWFSLVIAFPQVRLYSP